MTVSLRETAVSKRMFETFKTKMKWFYSQLSNKLITTHTNVQTDTHTSNLISTFSLPNDGNVTRIEWKWEAEEEKKVLKKHLTFCRWLVTQQTQRNEKFHLFSFLSFVTTSKNELSRCDSEMIFLSRSFGLLLNGEYFISKYVLTRPDNVIYILVFANDRNPILNWLNSKGRN